MSGIAFIDFTTGKSRTIKRSSIMKCPMFILLPEHYRDDESCRCDETTCEYSGCKKNKYNGEIFCKKHTLE